jgi:hypothetical protein
MPATKKISPKAIVLSIAGFDERATASGKHSSYPKRPAVAAPFSLAGEPTELKRVSGSWKGERLEFIYWREDGVARWTDLTIDEARAIDAGAAVAIVARFDPKEDAQARHEQFVAAKAEPAAEPEVKTKRVRKGRKVAADEPALV